MIGIYSWKRPPESWSAFWNEPLIARPFRGNKPSRLIVRTPDPSTVAAAEKAAVRLRIPLQAARHAPFLPFENLPLSLSLIPAGTSTPTAPTTTPKPPKPEDLARARALINQWRSLRLSSFNTGREWSQPLPPKLVLVADETGANNESATASTAARFRRLMAAASATHPDAALWVFPARNQEGLSEKGVFEAQLQNEFPKAVVLAQNIHPVRLLEHAEAVYVLSAFLGFEALLWDKTVHTFAPSFYSHRGLTKDDAQDTADTQTPLSLEELAFDTLVDAPRYRHPETAARCEPEALFSWLGVQRQMRERFPTELVATGFSPWKQALLRRFFSGSNIHFLPHARSAQDPRTRVLWGSPSASPSMCPTERIAVEDGFIRSVGLGAGLARPLSWVTDKRGIYYDATRESDLEHLLEHHTFSDELRERAKSLVSSIVVLNLTKYNVGAAFWKRPPHLKRVILVPGQVEADASLRFGSPRITTNLELLRTVRAAAPEAFIVYKPHPDVVAGLRAQGRSEQEAAAWCDAILTDAPMAQLLEEIDEVHLLTSLTGFEALLRGKTVFCYGLPFYAGWGLTHDTEHCPRRTRKRSLEELVAATLLLYPTYLSRETGLFTTPERTIFEITEWRRARDANPPGVAARLLQAVLHFVVSRWNRFRDQKRPQN
jgi:capsular polysaccharide export protein